MSAEFQRCNAPGEENRKSRRGILQSPPHEEEVASSFHPRFMPVNMEAGGGSHSMLNDSTILLDEFRSILIQNQLNMKEQLKDFLGELKRTIAGDANLDGSRSQARGISIEEIKTPVTNPVGRPRKRTPKSAPPARKKKINSVALWEQSKKAAELRQRFDPNFPPYDHRSISAFEKWYTEGTSSTGECLITIASKVVHVVDAHWFDCVWGKGHLGKQHMDVLASVIARDHDVDRAFYATRKWTWLETDTWDILRQPKFAAVPASLWPFTTGFCPKEGGKPWTKSTRVFGFGLVMEDNWVLYELSFVKQRITVYDPRLLPWNVVSLSFDHMRSHIPAMCRMARVWEAQKFSEPLRAQWEVVPYPNPPQALIDADSGVMCLKVMQALAYDLEPAEVMGIRCDFFRKHFCGRLVVKSPDIHITSAA